MLRLPPRSSLRAITRLVTWRSGTWRPARSRRLPTRPASLDVAAYAPDRPWPRRLQGRHRFQREDDAELRSLTAALLEDEQLDTIECESAEPALAVMLIGGQHVALIFADIRLRGVVDGLELGAER